MSATPQSYVKTVSVTVAGGTVTCTPDTVDVTHANTLVVFTLDTASYTFPSSSAIVVTTSSTDFPYASWTLKPQTAAIFDAKGINGSFKYSATVLDSGGNPISNDPVIHNTTP
jgi:hypothetical protein